MRRHRQHAVRVDTLQAWELTRWPRNLARRQRWPKSLPSFRTTGPNSSSAERINTCGARIPSTSTGKAKLYEAVGAENPSVQVKRRSSGMCVLVEDAGESVLSPDVEVVESAGIGDRLRLWTQRCCCV